MKNSPEGRTKMHSAMAVEVRARGSGLKSPKVRNSSATTAMMLLVYRLSLSRAMS